MVSTTRGVAARRLAAALAVVLASSSLRADPPTGGEWEPIPELSDEFDGDRLDAAKWHDHNPRWKGRQPGFFSKGNVTVSGGKLRLTARAEELPDLPEGYHTFTTAAVKSRTTVLYGYFEIRCRPMRSRASSAFWFYDDTPERWTEIDVFEVCGEGEKWLRRYHMNVHVFRTPESKEHWSKPGVWIAPEPLVDRERVYGLEWDEKRIRWYVDGKVVREIENTHWHQPLHLNFDSETMPEWFGLPSKESLPAEFTIDWVRSWRRRAARSEAAPERSAPAADASGPSTGGDAPTPESPPADDQSLR